MLPRPRKHFTLLPAISLIALSLLAAMPAFTGMHAYAATRETVQTVIVKQGDTLWAIAAVRTTPGGNVTDLIDRIVAVNHLQGGSLQTGQHIQIPR